MRLRSISRYIYASLAAVFFLGITASAQTRQPGLVHLDQEGAKTMRDSAAAAGGKTPVAPTPSVYRPSYRGDEVLVKMKEYAANKEEKGLASDLGVEKARKLHTDKVGPGIYTLKLKPGDTVEDKIKELKSHPDVEFVQPNYIYRTEATPNDTYFKRQWDIYNTGQTVQGQVGKAGADMKMTSAWGISTGSKDIVVAVIDTGIDYFSPDLADNLWTNPSPGSYSSFNNYTGTHAFNDDVHGFNPLAFDNYSGTSYTDPGDPYDDYGHGTHVSGTIGASGNNAAGVTGINWTTSIMALKGLDFLGEGSDTDIIECLNYAVYEKQQYDANLPGANVRVINASFGGPSNGPVEDGLLKAAIQAASDNNILFVAAAGNGTKATNYIGTNNDISPLYPAYFSLSVPNVIAVAATDNKDILASFSNYGLSVAVAAPGANIISTLPVSQPFFFDDFEHGMKWTRGGVNDTWGITTESSAPVSPTHSLTDSPGAPYVSNTDSFVTSPAVDLSSATTPIKLGYLMNLDTELQFDGVNVWVSPTDNGPWSVVDGWSGITGAYDLFSADISSLAGASHAHVRFEFISDATVNLDGVHLDNVMIGTKPSTVQPMGLYWYESGTSMAAPHVTGLAALILAANPGLTMSQVKDIITSSVDLLPGLSGKVASGGRVNGMKALAAVAGDGLTLAVSQSGGYTVMTARFISGGSLQYGKYIKFYQDGVLIGTILTGGTASATPGIATLKVNGKAGDHAGSAVSVAATGVPSMTSNTVNYHTYPPTIATVNPPGSPGAAAGTAVTVTGSHFSPTMGTVSFTGSGVATAVAPTFWNDTTIKFKVPARVAGDYALTVKNFAMTSGPPVDPAYMFTIPAPSISVFRVSGSAVPGAAPGVFINMSGTYFGPVTGTISMKSSANVVTAVTPASWTDLVITFKVPSIKNDTYQLTVTNAAGASTKPFAIPLPAISGGGVSPNPASPGTRITISGNGFGVQNAYSFIYLTGGGLTINPVPLSWSDTAITFKTSRPAGNYTLSVGTAAGKSGAAALTIPHPAITGLDPQTAAAGVFVNMSGTGFGLVKGSITMQLQKAGTIPAAVASNTWSDSLITFVAPPKPLGSYSIRVSNAAGKSSPATFTVPLPDTSGGLSPTSQTAGTAVTITGKYFGTVKGTVLVTPAAGGTVSAVTPTAWLDGSITFAVPARAAGAYKVSVKNAAGTSTPGLDFTISP